MRFGRAAAQVFVVHRDVVAQVAGARVDPTRAVALGDRHGVLARGRVAVRVRNPHSELRVLRHGHIQVGLGFEDPRAVGLHRQRAVAGVDGVADVVFRAVEDNLQAARAVRVVVVYPTAGGQLAFGDRVRTEYGHFRHVVRNHHTQFGLSGPAVRVRRLQGKPFNGHGVGVRVFTVHKRMQQRGLHPDEIGGSGCNCARAGQLKLDHRHAVLGADQVVAHLGPGQGQFHAARDYGGGTELKREAYDVGGSGLKSNLVGMGIRSVAAGMRIVQVDGVAAAVANPARTFAVGNRQSMAPRGRVAVAVRDFQAEVDVVHGGSAQARVGREAPGSIGFHRQSAFAGVDRVADVVLDAVDQHLQAAGAVRVIVVHPGAGHRLAVAQRAGAAHADDGLVVFDGHRHLGRGRVAVRVRHGQLQTGDGHGVRVRAFAVHDRLKQGGFHFHFAARQGRDGGRTDQFQLHNGHAVLVADQIVAHLAPGQGHFHAAGIHLGSVRARTQLQRERRDVVRTGREADLHAVGFGRAAAQVLFMHRDVVAEVAGTRVDPGRAVVAARDVQVVVVNGGIAVFIRDFHAEAHVLGNAVVQVVGGLEGPGSVGLHGQNAFARVDGVADIVFRAVEHDFQLAGAVRIVVVRPGAGEGFAAGHARAADHVHHGLVVFDGHRHFGRGRVAVRVRHGQLQTGDGHGVRVRAFAVHDRFEQRGFHFHFAARQSRDGGRADQFQLHNGHAVLVAHQIVADLGPGQGHFHPARVHLGSVRARAQLQREAGDVVRAGREAHFHAVRFGRAAAQVLFMHREVVAEVAGARVNPGRTVGNDVVDAHFMFADGRVAVGIRNLHAEGDLIGADKVVGGLEGPGAVGLHGQNAFARVDGVADVVFRAVEHDFQFTRAVRIVVVRPGAGEGFAFGHARSAEHFDHGLVVFNGHRHLGRSRVAVRVRHGQLQTGDGHGVGVRAFAVHDRFEQRGFHFHFAARQSRDRGRADQFQLHNGHAVLVAHQIVADLGPGQGHFHAARVHFGSVRARAQLQREAGDVVRAGRKAHLHAVGFGSAAAQVLFMHREVVAEVAGARVDPGRAVAAVRGNGQIMVAGNRVAVAVRDFHGEAEVLSGGGARGFEGPRAVGFHGQNAFARVDGVAEVVFRAVEDDLQAARAVGVVVVRPGAGHGFAADNRAVAVNGNRRLIVFHRHRHFGCGRFAGAVRRRQAQTVDGHAVGVRGHAVLHRLQQRGLHAHIARAVGADDAQAGQFQLDHIHAVLGTDQGVADLGPGDVQGHAARDHLGGVRAGGEVQREVHDVFRAGGEAHLNEVHIGIAAAGMHFVQDNVVAQAAAGRIVPGRAVVGDRPHFVRGNGGVAVAVRNFEFEFDLFTDRLPGGALEAPGAVGLHGQGALAGVDGVTDVVFRAVEDDLQAARAVRVVVVRPGAFQELARNDRAAAAHGDFRPVVFNRHRQLGRNRVAVAVRHGQLQAVDAHGIRVRSFAVHDRPQQRGFHFHLTAGLRRDGGRGDEFQLDHGHAVLGSDQIVADLGPGDVQGHAARDDRGSAGAGAQVQREPDDVVGTGREADLHGVRIFGAAAGVGFMQRDVVAEGAAAARVVPGGSVAVGDLQIVVAGNGVAVFVRDSHGEVHGLGDAAVQVGGGGEGPGAVGLHDKDALAGVDLVADGVFLAGHDHFQAARAVRIIGVGPDVGQNLTLGNRARAVNGNRRLVVFHRHGHVGRDGFAAAVRRRQEQAVDGHAVRVRGHAVVDHVQQRGFYGHAAGAVSPDDAGAGEFQLNYVHAVLAADQGVADLAPGDVQGHAARDHFGGVRAGTERQRVAHDVFAAGGEADLRFVRLDNAAARVNFMQHEGIAAAAAGRVVPRRAFASPLGNRHVMREDNRVVVGIGDFQGEGNFLRDGHVEALRAFEGPRAVGLHGQNALAGVDGVADIVLLAVKEHFHAARAVGIVGMRPGARQGRPGGHGVAAVQSQAGRVVHDHNVERGRTRVAVAVGERHGETLVDAREVGVVPFAGVVLGIGVQVVAVGHPADARFRVVFGQFHPQGAVFARHGAGSDGAGLQGYGFTGSGFDHDGGQTVGAGEAVGLGHGPGLLPVGLAAVVGSAVLRFVQLAFVGDQIVAGAALARIQRIPGAGVLRRDKLHAGVRHAEHDGRGGPVAVTVFDGEVDADFAVKRIAGNFGVRVVAVALQGEHAVIFPVGADQVAAGVQRQGDGRSAAGRLERADFGPLDRGHAARRAVRAEVDLSAGLDLGAAFRRVHAVEDIAVHIQHAGFHNRVRGRAKNAGRGARQRGLGLLGRTKHVSGVLSRRDDVRFGRIGQAERLGRGFARFPLEGVFSFNFQSRRAHSGDQLAGAVGVGGLGTARGGRAGSGREIHIRGLHGQEFFSRHFNAVGQLHNGQRAHRKKIPDGDTPTAVHPNEQIIA